MKNDMSPNDSVDDYEFAAAAAEDIAFMIPTDRIASLNDYRIMMMLMNSKMKSTMSFIWIRHLLAAEIWILVVFNLERKEN